ncbi:MAG: hypothetical protein ABI343_05195 [Burkholderiaceae bacterium]
MAAAPRNVPRFLPTLTEVVQRVPHAPSAAPPIAPLTVASDRQPSLPPGPHFTLDPQPIVQSVNAQLDVEMEELFREALKSAMAAEIDAIAARLRQEIEPLLRQAVAEMVANEIALRRHH